MKLTIPRELTLRTIDAVLRGLNRLGQTDQLDLNLANLRWTEPAGLLPLTSKIRGHISSGGRTVIENFPTTDTCGHLERMNFYAILGLDCPHQPKARHEPDDRFIKITEIGSHDISNPMKAKLDALVRAHVPVDGHLGDSFLVACSELIQNTKHAYNTVVDSLAIKWPQALVQSQYYDAPRCLHICVADSGLGIKRSIGAKDPDTYKDDRTAIEAALILGMRGGLGTLPGKGLGLAAIRRFMHQSSPRRKRSIGCPHGREPLSLSKYEQTVTSTSVL